MAKISTYVIDGTIVDGDKVIGSDANNDMITKNYTIGDLVAYFAVSIGNNYFVPYVNANNDVDLGSFSLLANNLTLTNTITVDGSAGLPGQVIISQGSGAPAVWGYGPQTQDLSNVLNIGNTATKSIILDNANSLIELDVEGAHGTANIYITDKTTPNTAQLSTTFLSLEDSSLFTSAVYLSNKIRYNDALGFVDVLFPYKTNQAFVFPSVGGFVPVSVNGNFADSSGNILLPTSTDVTSVTATAPLSSSGGQTPDISISQAGLLSDGYLSSTDWNSFNSRVPYIGATSNVTLGNHSITADNGIYNSEVAPDFLSVSNSSFANYGALYFDRLEIVDTAIPSTMQVKATGLIFPDNTVQTTAAVAVSPAALTRTNDTNVTLTLGGSPSTALLQGVSLTLGWTGTLADSRITSAATWNAKQDPISLTTTGTSGAATFIGNTLNIPQYQAAGTYVTGVGATGPITSSGGTTPTISTSMNTSRLIGRTSAGLGVMEEISVGSGLSLSGGTLTSNVTGLPKATASGTDTYTTTIAGVSGYADGDAYLIRFTNGNTTSATLNINGLGAIQLYRNNDGPVIGGDIFSGSEMICVYNSTTTAFQVIGTSPNSLISYVTNDDSVTLTKGMAVYAFSGTGDRMTVKRAFNTSDSTSAQTVGLVLSASIGVNQKGFIMMQGLLDGLNILPTATWNDGDPVYLGSTAGSITKTKPYAPNHLVYLGIVTTASNGSAGRMYVRVQNGYELDELHNVQAQTPALKDTLWYDNTVSPAQWKTASISTILGYTPVSGSGTSTRVAFWSAGTALSSDNDLYWDNSNKRLGLGTSSPAYRLDINGNESIQGYLNLKPSAAPTSIRISSNDTLNGGSASNDVDRLVLIGNNVATNLSLKTSNQGDSLIGIGFAAANTITSGGIYSIYIGRNSGVGVTTGGYNTHIGSGDANNIPSTTRSTIHIVAGGGYQLNDAASVLTGLTSRYAFIGGGFSSAEYINNFYFGAGPFVTDPNLANLSMFAPSGVGTDLQGANFTLNAGRGTGSGTPGDLIFQTSTAGASGTTLQTLSQRLSISGGTGAVTINNLSGAGTRMVVANATGVLSTQAITTGTVTSVGALTLGTSGTDLSSTVANGTTTPIITLNVPTASATNRGVLSSASWQKFNNAANIVNYYNFY